eukprot:7366127-Prymnesium_polylepis.2
MQVLRRRLDAPTPPPEPWAPSSCPEPPGASWFRKRQAYYAELLNHSFHNSSHPLQLHTAHAPAPVHREAVVKLVRQEQER